MSRHSKTTHLKVIALMGALLAGAVVQMPAYAQSADPPGRVVRLNYLSGAVSILPAGATDWSSGELNRPLTTGDQVWADNDARAELHIGSAALRLGAQTSLDVVSLDDQSAQLRVAQGTLELHVRAVPAGGMYEIDTPNVALQLNSPGAVRVDVAADGSATTVTLRGGNAVVYGDTSSLQLASPEQLRFSGTALASSAATDAPGLDAFDQWVAGRDRAEDNIVAARYVSREVPGYEDLDANGSWRSVPNYGNVWIPRAVPAGWAPYRSGHWSWIAPWGWTWIDDAPWGFATTHYGRWAYVDNSWGWVPGPVAVSQPPVYAPALVAFVGDRNDGANWSVNLALGAAAVAAVAWLPLGPGEPWHPPYHYSAGYYSRVNNYTTNNRTTVINNVYINQRAPNGITAVDAHGFVRGAAVGPIAHSLRPDQLGHGHFDAGGPALAPVRESFGAGLRPVNVRPPAALGNRQVLATRAPVVPPAFHDTLAQRYAPHGTLPGAGPAVVRQGKPPGFANRPGVAANAPGSRAPAAANGGNGFHVVSNHSRPAPAPTRAGAAPGAHGAPPAAAGGLPAGAPGQRPGGAGQPANVGEPQRPQQPPREPQVGHAAPGQQAPQAGRPAETERAPQANRPPQAERAPQPNQAARPPEAPQRAAPAPRAPEREQPRPQAAAPAREAPQARPEVREPPAQRESRAAPQQEARPAPQQHEPQREAPHAAPHPTPHEAPHERAPGGGENHHD
ncbi:MAG: DUF6600 domain-containing protein [Janthinobacterium lividum]